MIVLFPESNRVGVVRRGLLLVAPFEGVFKNEIFTRINKGPLASLGLF